MAQTQLTEQIRDKSVPIDPAEFLERDRIQFDICLGYKKRKQNTHLLLVLWVTLLQRVYVL